MVHVTHTQNKSVRVLAGNLSFNIRSENQVTVAQQQINPINTVPVGIQIKMPTILRQSKKKQRQQIVQCRANRLYKGQKEPEAKHGEVKIGLRIAL